MNKTLTLIFTLFTAVVIGQHNPYTGAIDWTPNSGPGVPNGTFKCGQNITADFNFGITGLDSVPTNIGLTFTVGIAGALEYEGASVGADAGYLISGPFSEYFTYSFVNLTTIRATQSDTIPATGPDPLNPIQGNIEVGVKVKSSAVTGDQFVINVNLQIPGTLPGNVQADDNESTTGDVDCPTGEISGFVTVINNAPNNGPLSGVSMELYRDISGAFELIRSTVTDNTGFYFFDSLTTGTYEVRQNQPTGFTSVSDQDATPNATPTGDISDLFDAFAGFPVNNIVPVTLPTDGIDTDNNFVEEPASLPVEYLSFDVKAIDTDAKITWATASEINASHFDIERSKDGKNFEFITQIKANGNTTELSEYGSYDRELKTGKYYYRLKQVDFDGTFTYTEVRSITIEEDFLVELYPNPTTGLITIDLNKDLDVKSIDILDNTGKLVRSINALSETYDVGDLTNGVYYVRVIASNASITKRFIKVE